jgi:hypothetical protein
MEGDRNMTVEYKDSKRITAVSSDFTTDTTSNITWSATGKVGWDISGTTISRTGSAGWGTSKIQSTDTFTVGDGAFMIEFSGIHSCLNSAMIGFNTGTLGYHIGSPANQIDFGIYVAGGSRVEVYESGTKNYDSGGSRCANDRFRIEVSNSGVVKYYLQEGGTGSFDLKHTSSSTASGTYFIQANAYADTSEATVHSKTVTTAVAKPSDVKDNSILVEKDTARRYWFNANPLFNDDLSTDNFTHADSSKTSVSSNKFNWEVELDNSDDTAYQPLGLTLDNSSWVMRFKITTDTLATASNPGAFGKFVLASSNAGQSGSFDWIGFERYVSSASNSWNLGYGDGTSGNTATDGFTTTPAASSTYYMELIRDGATITGKMFTGSDYSTGLVDTTTLSMSGTIEGLSFFKFYNRSDNNNASQTATGTLEDLKVWNGVTTASGGGTWTMQSTFEDDFSTDKCWVSSGAQAKIDSSGYLLFDDDSDGSAHKIYYDIGNTIDDTKWLWRFKLTTNTFSMNSDPTPQIVHMRISNKTDHRDSATEDAIGMSFRTSDGSQKYIRTTYSDGATFGTTSNFSTQIATGTHYVQITRDSSTQFTVKLYSDSSYSSLVESKSVTIPSTITDLRYLKIDNMTSDGTSNGSMIFHIDDMEVYSGVTSKN